jgi:hypothetical protein
MNNYKLQPTMQPMPMHNAPDNIVACTPHLIMHS